MLCLTIKKIKFYFIFFFVKMSHYIKIFFICFSILFFNYRVLSQENQNQKAIEQLINQLGNSNYLLKQKAFNKLKKNKNKAIAPMILALKHSNPEIRRMLVKILGELKVMIAIDSLIELLEDDDCWVWIEAVKALGKLKSKKAIPYLIDGLKKGGCDKMQNPIPVVLAQFGSSALNATLDALKDKETVTRINAAKALGLIKSPKSIQFLYEVLNDSSEWVIYQCAHSLANFGEKAAPLLIKGLMNNNPKTRKYVAEALGNIKSNRVINALIQALDDYCWEVCFSAYKSLKKMGDPKAKFFIHDFEQNYLFCNSLIIKKKVMPKFPSYSSILPDKKNVIIIVLIDERGVVKIAAAIKDGDSKLIKAAVDSIRKWSFKPIYIRGVSRPVKIFLEFHFSFIYKTVMVKSIDNITSYQCLNFEKYEPHDLVRIAFPKYPKNALDKRIEDDIEVEAITDIYGRVKSWKFKRFKYPQFKPKITEALKHWVYNINIISGRPYSLKVNFIFHFHVQE